MTKHRSENRKGYVVRARITDAQRARLLGLVAATGTNESWVIRRLLDDAQLVSVLAFGVKTPDADEERQACQS